MDNTYNNPSMFTNKSKEDQQLDELLASIKKQQEAAQAEQPVMSDQLSAMTSAFFDDFPSSPYSPQTLPDSPYQTNDYNDYIQQPLPPTQPAAPTFSGLPPIWETVDLSSSEETARINDGVPSGDAAAFDATGYVATPEPYDTPYPAGYGVQEPPFIPQPVQPQAVVPQSPFGPQYSAQPYAPETPQPQYQPPYTPWQGPDVQAPAEDYIPSGYSLDDEFIKKAQEVLQDNQLERNADLGALDQLPLAGKIFSDAEESAPENAVSAPEPEVFDFTEPSPFNDTQAAEAPAEEEIPVAGQASSAEEIPAAEQAAAPEETAVTEEVPVAEEASPIEEVLEEALVSEQPAVSDKPEAVEQTESIDNTLEFSVDEQPAEEAEGGNYADNELFSNIFNTIKGGSGSEPKKSGTMDDHFSDSESSFNHETSAFDADFSDASSPFNAIDEIHDIEGIERLDRPNTGGEESALEAVASAEAEDSETESDDVIENSIPVFDPSASEKRSEFDTEIFKNTFSPFANLGSQDESASGDLSDIFADAPAFVDAPAKDESENAFDAPSPAPEQPKPDFEVVAKNADEDEDDEYPYEEEDEYADSEDDEDDYKIPPYIAARAVKRTAKGKKKKVPRSSPRSESSKPAATGKKRGKVGLIIASAAVVLVVAVAALLFPSIKFSVAILNGDYDGAALRYSSDIKDNRLQSAISDKVAELAISRILNSYADQTLDYDAASAALSKLSVISSLSSMISDANASLNTFHLSETAYLEGSDALSSGDFVTAVEKLSLVDEASEYYSAAASKLSDASSKLKNQLLENTANNFAAGTFTAMFKDYDTADRLLADDADIAAQYAEHQAAYETYIVQLAKDSVMSGDYEYALSAATYAAKICHKSEILAALSENYSAWLTPTNVFSLAASSESNSSSGNYSERDWAVGNDADITGNTEYSSGKVFVAASTNSYSKTYDIASAYELLSGTFTPHLNSAGINAYGVYGRLYIYGDGSLLYSSDTIDGESSPIAFSVDVSDVDTLRVVVDINTSGSTELTVALANFHLIKNLTDFKATL